MLLHHLSLRDGADGIPVVEVTLDVAPEQVCAALQALRTIRDARYRTIGLSVDDALALRELTALVDQLADMAGADGIAPLRTSVAGLNVLCGAVDEFAAAEHVERAGDTAHRPAAHRLADDLADVRADAVRAALDGVAAVS